MILRLLRGILTVFAMLSLGWMLAGCGLLDDKADETKGWSAQKLYAEARANLDTRNYEKAVSYYQKLEGRYPYGRFAQQAQMELAYAYYKDKEATPTIPTSIICITSKAWPTSMTTSASWGLSAART